MQHNLFFFFNDTATTEIYTLSLHDALPIWHIDRDLAATDRPLLAMKRLAAARARVDDDRAGLGETRLAPRRAIEHRAADRHLQAGQRMLDTHDDVHELAVERRHALARVALAPV